MTTRTEAHPRSGRVPRSRQALVATFKLRGHHVVATARERNAAGTVLPAKNLKPCWRLTGLAHFGWRKRSRPR